MIDDAALAELEKRFADGFGCPPSLRDLAYAPWVFQLKRDAVALLAEVKRLRQSDERPAMQQADLFAASEH